LLPSGDPVGLLAQRAEVLWIAGRYEESVDFAEQALALDPENFDAHFVRANALQLSDRLSEALAAAETCCRISSDTAAAHRVRSSILGGLGRTGEAVESANRAVLIDPSNPASLCMQANALMAAKRWNDAHTAIRQAKDLDPELPMIYEAEGNIFLEQEKYVLAESAYRNALSLDPDAANVKFNLALVLCKTNRADDAVALTRALIIEDPKDRSNVRALIRHGDAYVRGGRANRWFARCRQPGVGWFIIPFLLPFAWFERRRRRELLPAGTWAAITMARKSSDFAKVKRDLRDARVRVALTVLQLIAWLMVVALLLFLFYRNSQGH
jgi:tetratricopeptide (TPR) repeat protein